MFEVNTANDALEWIKEIIMEIFAWSEAFIKCYASSNALHDCHIAVNQRGFIIPNSEFLIPWASSLKSHFKSTEYNMPKRW